MVEVVIRVRVGVRLDDDDVVEHNTCQTEVLMCVCHSIK